jgi:hypothetical protein
VEKRKHLVDGLTVALQVFKKIPFEFYQDLSDFLKKSGIVLFCVLL